MLNGAPARCPQFLVPGIRLAMPTRRSANRLTMHLVRFHGDRKANVAITFALVMIPTVYLLGMALDYSLAVRKRSQLNAAIDAAAISAVTPSMLAQSSSVATTTATNVFNATANGMPGLSGPPALNVTITNSGLVRTATVSYKAASINNFPILLRAPVWQINGTSTATSSGGAAPNINFYLLLDDSPSMAIAGTLAGITKMLNNTTPQQGQGNGCAFACHQKNAAGLGNPGGEDNYALARKLGVTLRIDMMAQAAANLMSTATTTEAANNNTYKMAIYTFDTGFNTVYAPSGMPSANLTAAATAAANIQLLEVYDENDLTASKYNADTDTDFSDALQALNTIMPAPGGGTNNVGDTPQEVVFVVTDGVEDKAAPSSACSQPIAVQGSISRCEQPIDTTWCTTVKNRGIRIAVVYTEYLQLTTSLEYNGHVAAFNNPTPATSPIATNLQACASPGLFADVASGGDITAALNNLFQVVATSPHLTH
jgi:Flp pilus assembly protein TadG